MTQVGHVLPLHGLVMHELYFNRFLDLVSASLKPILQVQVLRLNLILKRDLRLLPRISHLLRFLLVLLVQILQSHVKLKHLLVF